MRPGTAAFLPKTRGKAEAQYAEDEDAGMVGPWTRAAGLRRRRRTAARGPGPGSAPKRARGQVRLPWIDLAVAFCAYLAGLLGAGLALGGDRARDVAVGNAVGVGCALAGVAAMVAWRRWQRRRR
ncbi:hypothetical protein ACFOOM_23320 [Streptomyces echinoruber]|uniref:Uncharacterized protein n=1 Tax=Streptomyces echinoruber TaxID=68898 RepID=A0A918RB60_9ACTN|nr:hypothetical protein [Streptomyces echinoruber]GGZ92034.1 hypothetical protein GCM10010389_33270 [Streptomyces echinoruber]